MPHHCFDARQQAGSCVALESRITLAAVDATTEKTPELVQISLQVTRCEVWSEECTVTRSDEACCECD